MLVQDCGNVLVTDNNSNLIFLKRTIRVYSEVTTFYKHIATVLISGCPCVSSFSNHNYRSPYIHAYNVCSQLAIINTCSVSQSIMI